MEENLQYQKMNNTKIFNGSDYDNVLSVTSENAVQNKVITKALNDKVEKELGKGLSENDFTNIYRDKLDSLQVMEEVQIIGWTIITPSTYEIVDLRDLIAQGKHKFTILVYIRKSNIRQVVKFELTTPEINKILSKVNNNVVCITRSCVNPTNENDMSMLKQCMKKHLENNTPVDGVIELMYDVYDNGSKVTGFDNFEWCMYAE